MKLNIQLFAGSVSIQTIVESTIISYNQSIFTIEAKMTTTGATYNNDNAYMTLQWKYASSSSWTSLSKQTFGIGQSSSKTKSWTLTLEHNLDGTLEDINFRVKWYITDSTNGTTSTTTRTPTPIPRASEIDSVYATSIPSYPHLTFTPKSSSFKYKVRYIYNNLTYQSSLISPNTTSPYTFGALQIPIDVFSGVSSSSITITAYLYTYDANNNPITPTATKTFQVDLTDDAKPTITIDHLSEADTTMQTLNWKDGNNNRIYVQGKSKLSFRLVTYYSEIQAPSVQASANTNGQTFNSTGYHQEIFTTSVLKTSGSNSITASAIDSRNRTATATAQTYNVVAYSVPTINTAQVQRCDINGNVDKNGQYCLISYSASISSCDNHNKANAEYKVGYRVQNTGSYTYVPLATNVNSKSASGILFTDGIKSASSSGTKVQFSDSTYDIQFYVKDSFTTITNTQSLDAGFDLLNFNPSGKAMAIGKVSEAGSNEELLEIALPTKFTEYVKDELVVESIRSKNMLGLINGTYTSNGITAAVSNGVITLNGTASDTSFIDLPTNSNINWTDTKQYTISAFNPTANNMVRIRLQSSGSYDMKLTNTNQTGTINYSASAGIYTTKITIRVQSGEVLNNFKIIPQIELGLTGTNYSPHQNLSPTDGSVQWLSNGILTINKGSLVNNRSYYTNNTIQFNIKLSGVSINANSGTTIITLPSDFAGTVETSLCAIANNYAPVICWFRTDGTIAIASNVALSNVEIRITGGLYRS